MRSHLCLLLLTMSFAAAAANPTAERGVALANKDLEKSGSPYRWAVGEEKDGMSVMEKHLLGEPCTTVADAVLTSDTLANIGTAEARFEGSTSPQLLETRCVAPTRKSKGVKEIWVVARGEKQVPYVVVFHPDPKGGVTMEITGPW